MKTAISNLKISITIFCAIILFQACVKDTVTQKYTFYRPVYKTKEAVINGIKSGESKPIKETGKIFMKGNFIFLNDVNRGIHIIDYTNPNAPVKVAFVEIPGNVDMAVRGNILYADCYTSLVALDITNPLNVQRTKVINGVFPHRRYYNFQQDTSLVITDWVRVDTTIKGDFANNTNGIRYDMLALSNSNGGAHSMGSIANGTGGSMARFALLNERLYTVSNSDIKVFNTTVPSNPEYINQVSPNIWDIETIYPFGNNLFLGSNTGMHIFSVSNPNLPTKTGSFTHARVCDPVIAEQGFAYVTLRSGTTCLGFTNQLDVVNINNLNAPTLIKSYPLKNPHGLSKDGNTLLICDGADGLKIFNASDAQNITLLSTLGNMETFDVITKSGLAFVVAKDGLYCINYANVTNPVVASKISMATK